MSDAILIIILKNRKFLMVERQPDIDFYPKFWAPLHGQKNEDESFEDAVKRISKETLDIEVEPVRELKILLADYGAAKLHCWIADIKDGIPKITSDKFSRFKWMTWSDILKKDLLPATKSLFRSELKEFVLDKMNGGGKFIVLDGIDASGKKTHAAMLIEWLEEVGFVANKIAFPQYDQPFGAIVGKYLRGEYGGKDSLPPEVTTLLYATDRYHYAPKLKDGILNGEWFIADRYTPANIFQVAKETDDKKQDDLFNWLYLVESRMPQPDVVIILNQDPYIAKRLHEQRNLEAYMRNLKKDIHDEDIEYQARTMNAFLKYAGRMKNWFVVNCIEDGKLRSVDAIQSDIREIIEKKLLK